jgi:two-component system, OmpR family, torCAD operon response regulator TorR
LDTQACLLLIEDDPAQRLLLAAYLRQDGFRVLEAGNLAQGRALLQAGPPDLVLLDLNLPDGDGLELARELLRRDILVIIVTSRPQDRIPALELGADDYLDKPYQPRELLARVRNLLRRRGGQAVCFGGYRQDGERRSLTGADGREVNLTRGEFDLLAALVEARGRVVSRADLLECISPDGTSIAGRSVDVLISRLRRKLETAPGNPRLLVTVPGLGYRLQG